MREEFDATVRRGDRSWMYIYTTLGFALTIEGVVIALIAPLNWPRNIIIYGAASALTIYLWVFSGWFQNKLIGLRSRYEKQSRRTSLVGPLVASIVILVLAALAWLNFEPASLPANPFKTATAGGTGGTILATE